jgi:hypothetical protein
VNDLVLNADFWSATPPQEPQFAEPDGAEQFFVREDNGKVVRTAREYHHCGRKGVALRVVTRAEADELLEAEAAARRLRKEKRDKRRGRKHGRPR